MKFCQALLAVCVCAVLPLHAADLSDLIYTTTDDEVTITRCVSSATGELIIPDTIGGNPVISIGFQAFRNCRDLSRISIPDGATSIEDYAFKGCIRLTSIAIPDSVTSIGIRAFFGCQSLTSISIPDGVTSIGDYSFADCQSLTSITIPDGVTSIGGSAFFNCLSLASITIPDSLTSIGDGAFYNCASLTSISIPDSVTSIGDIAFYSCASLTRIMIPDSVTSIGDYAFLDSSSLTSITFQGAAPTVGLNIFLNVSEGATVYVQEQVVASFAAEGSIWEGLTVAIQRAITACGFMNATTFFIEFEPAGTGYRVMSSPTLDFSNAVEVTPTLEPISGEDNRFEFSVSGARNFYRLEPTE